MSSEIRNNKIAIDAKNHERFALVDNGKVVEIFGGCASKSAIAGNRNRITTNGIEPYTAVVGNGLKANIEGLAGAAAVAGKELKATVAGDHATTAISGRQGSVEINGDTCKIAVGVDEAEITISSDYNSTAICSCSSIKLTGNRNKIAVVGCSPFINCTGTDNNIISFGPYTTFSGTAGNCIAVADYDYERRVSGIVTGWIGENGLRENVRYRVRNGQFVETAVVEEAE